MRAVKQPLLEKRGDEKKRPPETAERPSGSVQSGAEKDAPVSSPAFEESLLSELLKKEPVRRDEKASASKDGKDAKNAKKPPLFFRLLTGSVCLFSLLFLLSAVLLTSWFLRDSAPLEVYLDGERVGYARSNADMISAVRDFEETLSVRLGSDVGFTFDGKLTYRFAAGNHAPTSDAEWQDIFYTAVQDHYSVGTALLLDGKTIGVLPDEKTASDAIDRILEEKNTLLAGENERIELRNAVSYEKRLCRKDTLLDGTALCLLLTEGDESLTDFRNSLLSQNTTDTVPDGGENPASEKEERETDETSGSLSQEVTNYPIGGGFNVVYNTAGGGGNAGGVPKPDGVPQNDSVPKPDALPANGDAPSGDVSQNSAVSDAADPDKAESGGETSDLPSEGPSVYILSEDLPSALPSGSDLPGEGGTESTVLSSGKLLKYQTVIATEEVVAEPCKIIYLPSENLYEGQSELYQTGLDGLRRDQTEVAFADGKLLSKTVLTSEYILEPRDEIILVGRKPCTATGVFLWPHRGLITSDLGSREIFGEQSMHMGLDIDGKTGDTVVAADGGVVTFAGWHDSYGYLTIIDHENGYETYYAHQSEIFVAAGDRVYQGQRIGLVGATGRASGSHLHFELHKDGVTIDPLPLLRAGESALSGAENKTDD